MAHNKNIMVGILLAEKALLKSPYVKRYVSRIGMSFLEDFIAMNSL